MNCECVSQINALLKEKHVELTSGWKIGKDGQLSDAPIIIQVNKIHGAPKGTKIPAVFPSYCPFCGKKCEEEV